MEKSNKLFSTMKGEQIMETNEIITNEAVEKTVDTIEEAVTASSGGSLKKMVGIGAVAILAGGLAYKFAVKPIVAKIKKRKQDKVAETDKDNVLEFDEIVDDSDYDEQDIYCLFERGSVFNKAFSLYFFLKG